jgi:hypothetical protein
MGRSAVLSHRAVLKGGAMMPILTHEQVLKRHLGRLLENERCLVAELRRVEHGLAAVQDAIAEERRALASSPDSVVRSAGTRAA